jgi:hypothetical protein
MQLYSVNLLYTMTATVCILYTAAHAISDDRAAKMQRMALDMITDLCYRNAFSKF